MPSESRLQDLRETFIHVSLEILEEQKTPHLELREVARRAGKSRTAPYLCFGQERDGGGRNALLSAVSARGFRMLGSALTEAEKGADDPSLAMREMARAYIGFARRHSSLFRLIFGPEFSEQLTLTGRGLRDLDELIEERLRVQRLLESTVGAAIASTRVDVANRAMTAWALLHGVASLLLDGQLDLVHGPEEQEQFIESAIDTMTQIVAGEIA